MRRLFSLRRFALPFSSLLLIAAAVPLAAEPVLIVPFFSRSPEANIDWISESIAHTIQDALESRGILVLGRTERETVYRRLSIRPNAVLTHATILKIAGEMDASTVVYGEYKLTPGGGPRGTLSVQAVTLDMKRLRKGQEMTESGPLEDLSAVQLRLAWQVLRRFAPDDAPSEDEFLHERRYLRLDAMENYTRGLMASATDQKRRFLLQAARLDPKFYDARYELGRLYWDDKEYPQAATWLKGIPKESSRYVEAVFLLGLCRYESGDYTAAEQAFATVAETVPLNEVFNNLGAAQSRLNRPQAVESFQTALDGDDADPDYHFNVGYALLQERRFDEAAAQLRAVLERNPEDGDAADLLDLAKEHKQPDADESGLERIKTNFEVRAYWQLKSAIDSLRKK